jgi:hypothetical protein
VLAPGERLEIGEMAQRYEAVVIPIRAGLSRLVRECRVPRQPIRVQLAVITVFADTYGSKKLTNPRSAKCCACSPDAVAMGLTRRMLFGKSSADQRSSVRSRRLRSHSCKFVRSLRRPVP